MRPGCCISPLYVYGVDPKLSVSLAGGVLLRADTGVRAQRTDPAYGSGASASVSACRERSGCPFTHVEGGRPKAQRPEKDREEVLYPAVEIAPRRRQMWRCRVKENPDQNVDNDEKTSCAEKGLEKVHSS
jgi:hypothetical protein